MNTQLMIETHGDPLGAIQRFTMNLWEEFNLDAMVVSQYQTLTPGTEVPTFLINQPGKLEEINPFKPLMTTGVHDIDCLSKVSKLSSYRCGD